MYYCKNCGPDVTFYGSEDYTETGSRDVSLDTEGNITEYGDYNDSETEGDGINNIRCQECNNEATYYGSTDDLAILEKERMLIKKAKEKINDWKSIVEGESK